MKEHMGTADWKLIQLSLSAIAEAAARQQILPVIGQPKIAGMLDLLPLLVEALLPFQFIRDLDRHSALRSEMLGVSIEAQYPGLAVGTFFMEHIGQEPFLEITPDFLAPCDLCIVYGSR